MNFSNYIFAAMFAGIVLAPISSLAQGSVENAKKLYSYQIQKAESAKTTVIEKAQKDYDAAVAVATKQIQTAYEIAIKQSAMRNDTESAAKYAKELDELNLTGKAPVNGSPNKKSFSSVPTGIWESLPGMYSNRTTIIEFQGDNKAILTQVYSRGGDGSSSTNVSVYRIIQRDNKLTLLATKSYSSNYKQYYEIQLPFDPNKLVITSITEQESSISKQDEIFIPKTSADSPISAR